MKCELHSNTPRLGSTAPHLFIGTKTAADYINQFRAFRSNSMLPNGLPGSVIVRSTITIRRYMKKIHETIGVTLIVQVSRIPG